jgi:hypothetical protein
MRTTWVGDVVKTLLYDFGPHMTWVSEYIAEIWGRPREEIWSRALSNLRALPRPRWVPLESGLYQLDSDVAYEETFLLVDEVVDALKFRQSAVLALPNRGKLFAADRSQPGALKALIDRCREKQATAAWPLSATLLECGPAGWRECVPPADLREAAKDLRRQDLGRLYQEQKQALDQLHERTQTDVFVATYALLETRDAPAAVQSWCTWSAGVETLLPQTDNVIFNRSPGRENPELLRVPWSIVERLCGHYLQPTAEDPTRYRVRAFPNVAE